MNSDHIEVLMREFQVHTDLTAKFLSPLYALVPVAVSACGVLLVNDKAGPAASGPATCVAIIVIMLWVGFVHSNILTEGIRLVEIELKVNELLGVKHSEFDYWTKMTAEGTRMCTGWVRLLIISAVAGALALAAGIWYGVSGFLQLGVPLWACLVSVAVILLFVGSIGCSMYRAEMDTRKAKSELIARYKSGKPTGAP
jgi:hypothetical protein